MSVNDSYTFVGENELCSFYTNSYTKTLTNYCSEDNIVSGVKGTKDYYVLLAKEKKDNFKSYLLCHNVKGAVYNTTSFESMCYYIDTLKLANSSDKE